MYIPTSKVIYHKKININIPDINNKSKCFMKISFLIFEFLNNVSSFNNIYIYFENKFLNSETFGKIYVISQIPIEVIIQLNKNVIDIIFYEFKNNQKHIKKLINFIEIGIEGLLNENLLDIMLENIN